jgi:hypothetical protein
VSTTTPYQFTVDSLFSACVLSNRTTLDFNDVISIDVIFESAANHGIWHKRGDALHPRRARHVHLREPLLAVNWRVRRYSEGRGLVFLRKRKTGPLCL